MPSQAARFAVFDGDLSQEWASFYSGSDALAVDTEAMGLCHGRDRLCLVQIADRKDRVCCVRIARGQNQAPRLQQLMESDRIVKAFHYARFDVAALRQGLGIAVQPIFCTKIGSRLARTYSPRHGLKDMVQELCGVELDKAAQSSDWGRARAGRPELGGLHHWSRRPQSVPTHHEGTPLNSTSLARHWPWG